MPAFCEVSGRSGFGGLSGRWKAASFLEALLGTPSLGLEIENGRQGSAGKEGAVSTREVFGGEGRADYFEIGIDLPLASNPFGLFLNSALGLSVEVSLDGYNLGWANRGCHQQKKKKTD